MNSFDKVAGEHMNNIDKIAKARIEANCNVTSARIEAMYDEAVKSAEERSLLAVKKIRNRLIIMSISAWLLLMGLGFIMAGVLT